MDFSHSSIAWAFERNPRIIQTLLIRYPRTHPYWEYLSELVSVLKVNGCKGIQEKIQDIGPNNLSKFGSTISELKVARLLSLAGKRVTLLSDNYLLGKSPDIYAEDSLGEYFRQ